MAKLLISAKTETKFYGGGAIAHNLGEEFLFVDAETLGCGEIVAESDRGAKFLRYIPCVLYDGKALQPYGISQNEIMPRSREFILGAGGVQSQAPQNTHPVSSAIFTSRGGCIDDFRKQKAVGELAALYTIKTTSARFGDQLFTVLGLNKPEESEKWTIADGVLTYKGATLDVSICKPFFEQLRADAEQRSLEYAARQAANK